MNVFRTELKNNDSDTKRSSGRITGFEIQFLKCCDCLAMGE